jgi:predicted secreted protein
MEEANYFPKLNRPTLISLALKWATDFDRVNKISLHHYIGDFSEHRYALLIFVDHTSIEKASSDLSPSYSYPENKIPEHILWREFICNTPAFHDVYANGEPHAGYLDEWNVNLIHDGNPTTGYAWKLAAIRVDVLEPGSEPEDVRDSTLPGAGGRFTFRFTARSQGYTKVILAYLRTWEKDMPPVKTFEMTADVNSSQEKMPVTTVHYLSNNGTTLTTSFDPNTNQIQVTLPDGRTILLPAAISASGARYSNAYETFWDHQGKGIYTKGDKVIFEGMLQAGK